MTRHLVKAFLVLVLLAFQAPAANPSAIVDIVNTSGKTLYITASGAEEYDVNNGDGLYLSGYWEMNQEVSIYARCQYYGYPVLVGTVQAKYPPATYYISTFDCGPEPPSFGYTYGVTAVNLTTNTAYFFMYSCDNTNAFSGPYTVRAGESLPLMRGGDVNNYPFYPGCVTVLANTNKSFWGAKNLLDSYATTNASKYVFLYGTWPDWYGSAAAGSNHFVNATFFNLRIP